MPTMLLKEQQKRGWWRVYQTGKATVRVHGQVDQAKIHSALEKFIKQVEQKYEQVKENEK